MGLFSELLDYFNKNKAIALIFILISAYFFMGGFKGLHQTLFMKICKEYQWKECTEWEEKCDTCTKYEYKTVTDCEKCGYELKIKASFFCNYKWGCGGLENLGKIKSASCGSCDSNGCEFTAVVEQNGVDYYYQGSWSYSGADYYECKSAPYGGIEIDAYKKKCKTCTIKVPVGTYPCNCRKVCVNWVTRTGSECPPDAVDCVCIREEETCGNGICEPEYGEDENTCPQDCKAPVKTCEDYGYTSNPPSCPAGYEPESVEVDGMICYTGRCVPSEQPPVPKTCEDYGYISTPPTCPEGYEPETVKIGDMTCYTGRCIEKEKGGFDVGWIVALAGIGGAIYYFALRRKGK